ncbi:MAG: type II toxin-antitoxin system prevent-host-death family antitoxin [Kiritimatiellia bacterium]
MTATEFKAKCLKVLDQVHQTGESLEISKRGNVIAVLTPPPRKQPWMALRGRGRMTGDPYSPVLGEDEIEALK